MAGFKERIKARVKAIAAGDAFKLKEDENFLRVLPTPESAEGADDEICFEIMMHNEVGPDKKFLRCGHSAQDKTEGECYLCDKLMPRLIAQGNSESANKIKPKWMGVFQVLTVEDNKWTGPFIWKVGGKLGLNILTILSTGKRDYTHQTKGYTFTIVRTGTGLKTEYSAPIADDDPSPVPQKYIDMLKPFIQLSEIPQYSEQAQRDAIRGVRSEDRDDDRSASRRRGVLDDDDEDDTPKAKKRSSVVVADEDEPAPVKTKRPAPVADEDDVPVRKPKPVVEADDDDDVPTPPRRVKPVAAVEPEDEDDVPSPPKKVKAVVKVTHVEPEEDEDETPAPVATKPPKRAPVVEADEEEDIPAPPPKKTAAKKAVAAAEDDDEPAPVRAPNGKRGAVAVADDSDDEDPFE